MPMQRIVFFGSSTEFSPLVLEKLVLSAKCQVLCVITTEDKPIGRHLVMTPNPVKVMAQKLNIPVYDKIKDFIMTTYDYSMTIGLVAAYGKILGPKTLSKLNNQIYGIHPSLLPKYRGPSPLQQQILDGITETGVTIFKIDLGEDTGPILMQEKDVILPTDTKISLGERLFEIGVNCFIENLLEIVPLSGRKLKIQNDSHATYTKKFTRQDGFIPFQELGASPPASRNAKHLRAGSQGLERMKRAFFPWPGVWTIDPEGKRIKLK